MIGLQQDLIRALIAAQVAVLEWGEQDISSIDGANKTLDALDQCLKRAAKLSRQLRKE